MSETHTARAHATLAPSAAKRWMACPGSVRATKNMPDETSEAAAEGTAAHELCSHCLETGEDPGTFLDMWVDIHARDGESRFVDDQAAIENAMNGAKNRYFQVDEEMVDAVSMYREHVLDLFCYGLGTEDEYVLEIEQRLDMTHLHPEIFGTGDATVFDDEEQHLHVVDFKYGKGVVVHAEQNPQLLLYAAGAARRYHNRKVAKLTMHIVQPRIYGEQPIKKYEIDLLDLFEFEDELQKAAALTDQPDAPFKAGPHCHDSFCKLQATCAVNRAYRLEAAGAEFGEVDIDTKFPPVDTLSDEQRGRVLIEADGLLAYVKAVQQKAHDDACAGRMPAGFKLVAKRANRKWRDEAAAVDYLTNDIGHKKQSLYHDPKLKSPAQMEHLFPGANKKIREAAMTDLVVKQSSGVNLVPASDPRPPVQMGAGSDFETVEDAT